MDRALYLSMAGARSSLLAQTSNANNLANVATTGFRADIEHFLSEPVYGPGEATRVYAESTVAGFDRSAGSLVQTGRALDIGLVGEAWLAVQDADGREAYTRRGDLRVDADGNLFNGEGLAVLGGNGPINLPPFEELNIGRDGGLSIRPLGAGPQEVVLLDQLRVVDGAGAKLLKGKDGLVREEGEQALLPDARLWVEVGALEQSNVNGIGAMISMIEYARGFESMVKFFEELEKMDSASTRLMSISG